jgi:hypothetical protein
MTISEFFSLVKLTKDGHPVDESRVFVTCSTCVEERNMGSIAPMSDGTLSAYTCPTCGNPLLTLGRYSLDSHEQDWRIA